MASVELGGCPDAFTCRGVAAGCYWGDLRTSKNSPNFSSFPNVIKGDREFARMCPNIWASFRGAIRELKAQREKSQRNVCQPNGLIGGNGQVCVG